jgi:hypothetical protein
MKYCYFIIAIDQGGSFFLMERSQPFDRVNPTILLDGRMFLI